MLLHPALISLLKLIYPIQEPNRTRDRPLEVLALGLPRSGTDSLRKALKQLGYDECYHGHLFFFDQVRDGPQWARLAWRKYHTNPSLSPKDRGLDATEFDKILGICRALTDMPGVGFACELVRAYPDAKVIINKREDAEAWYQSVLHSFDGPDVPEGFSRWRRCVFEKELFWMKAGRDAGWGHMTGYDFPKNGRDLYSRYYAELGQLLDRERESGKERKVLTWQVQDGWQPLIDFLGKATPISPDGKPLPFPSGNDQKSFIEMNTARIAEKVERAERRKRYLLAAGALACTILAAMWLHRAQR